MNQISITIDMLRKTHVDAVIRFLKENVCREYQSVFSQQAKNAKESGNQKLYEAWCLLSAITSMYLKPSDSQEPFGPMSVLDNFRSAIPEDLSDEILDILTIYYQEVADAELRARLADVLWLRRRRPEFAQVAIAAYVESARNLEDPEHWTECAKRVERALRLSVMFRSKHPKWFLIVTDYIEEVIDRYGGKDPLVLSVKFLGLLADFNHGDAETYYQLAFNIAEAARKAENWDKATQAWEVAEKWIRILKDQEKRNIVLSNMAETFAEQAMAADHGLISSRWIQQAIEIYKKVPNSKEHRTELYQQLRTFQKTSLTQMQLIEGPEVDISGSIQSAKKAVSGKSFEDALFILAFSIVKPPNYGKLKHQAEQNAQKFIFSQLFGAVHMDQDGLVVAHVPPNTGLDDDQQGKVIWADMLRTVQIEHSLKVQGAIEPARLEIILEHHVVEEKFFGYLWHNPFIPVGHEYLYAKGLCSGLTGDFITASHILVPQLENSFRHVLQQRGIETTTLNTQGLQERLRISAILEHHEFERIFGKDIALDLQALLIDRKYANLRNEISHGMMPTNYFNQPSVIYLWWLTLRLCLRRFLGKIIPLSP